MSADPGLSGRKLAAFGVNLLANEDYEVLRAFTSLTAEELKTGTASIDAPILVVPQAVIQTLGSRPVVGAEGLFDITVPLVSASGPTGLGLIVRVGTASRRPDLVGFEPAEPTAAQLEAYGSAEPAPRHRRRSRQMEPQAGKATPPRSDPDPPQPGASPVPERWRPVIAEAVHRLVTKDYAGMIRDGMAPERTGPEDLGFEHWIEEYPTNLGDLPEEAWAFTDHRATSQGWDVWVDLWSADQGRTDLTLVGVIHDDGDGPRLRIERVHVM